MTKVFLFDVDGTLTDPRAPMLPEFSRYFGAWAKSRIVYLVSGSDIDKVREQVPAETLECVTGIYACSGNELWTAGHCLMRRKHEFPEVMLGLLEDFVEHSAYPMKYGNHIETRTGMLNFSVPGRNASVTQRRLYEAWDAENGERQKLVYLLSQWFDDYEFSIGGQISIDIAPKGANKAQILAHLEELHGNCAFWFYGDRIEPGGNDRPLAEALHNRGASAVIAVEGYADTWDRLLTAESLEACIHQDFV